jgi:hypothetical protein
MTKNLDKRKYRLIQEIINMDDESSIARIEDQIEAIQKENNIWHAVLKPMRKTITLEEMKEEQNYIPLDEKTFFEMADEVGIEESIEELLAMLD